MSVSRNPKAICQFAYDVALFVQFNIAPTTNPRLCVHNPRTKAEFDKADTVRCRVIRPHLGKTQMPTHVGSPLIVGKTL